MKKKILSYVNNQVLLVIDTFRVSDFLEVFINKKDTSRSHAVILSQKETKSIIAWR